MNTRVLRIKSDLQSVTNDITDVLTSASPKFFAGEDVSIQVGVFTGSTVEDVSNVTSVITEIKALAAGGPPLGTSAYLVQKTNSSFDNTLDSATWNDGSKQHFTITLTDTDTGSLKEGIKWISSYAVLSDGTKITLFAGKIQVTEDGTGDSSGSDTEQFTLSTAGDLLTHDGTTAVRKGIGTTGQTLLVDFTDPDADGTNLKWGTPAGGGDVVGGGSSTDNAIARYNGTSGGLLQNSTTTIDDSGNLDVQGNITVSGTVDGRDIATDGTKLDGIEASATADQTGAEIKALYEAEANTNAYTDAEVSKLAGIETGADVTDETNVTSALSGATLTAITVASTDKVLVQDADDFDNLKTVTAQSIADLAVAGVSSVNSLTGAVVLDPDDLDDSATTNKFTTAGDISKLAGIEAGADVTDATNVISSLSGATITSATVATGDKVLIQDTDASDALKYVTAQSIADLASAGGGNLDLISSTTISSPATSITFTSGLDAAAYADLLVIFNNVTSNGTANAEMMLTVSTDGGTTYSTANAKQRMVQTGQDSAKNARNTYGRWDNTGGALSIDYLSADTTTTAYNLRSGGTLSGYLRIFNHQGSANKIVQSDVTHEFDGTSFYIFNIESGGMIDETGSINAIKFSFNGGTISFTGGTINLYGIKNA